MKPVTYKPNPDCEGGMEVHRYGKYVSESEYNEIKKQVNRLTKVGDAMAKAINEPFIDPNIGWDTKYLARCWHAAKKGGNS